MFQQLYYSFRNYRSHFPPLPLGRWNWKVCNTDVNIFLANIDSCGDHLCGSVYEIRKHLNQFHKEFKKNEIIKEKNIN